MQEKQYKTQKVNFIVKNRKTLKQYKSKIRNVWTF